MLIKRKYPLDCVVGFVHTRKSSCRRETPRDAFRRCVGTYFFRFWPTVLSVAPLVQHVVCPSVCLSAVTLCIQAKRLDRFAWMHHSFCIIVCYRAVRSAILATDGLLVKFPTCTTSIVYYIRKQIKLTYCQHTAYKLQRFIRWLCFIHQCLLPFTFMLTCDVMSSVPNK